MQTTDNSKSTAVVFPKITKKLYRAFPVLTLKNYRYYFAGQIISLAGTWLQIVAEGWLVWELTKSAFWVGVIIALGSLPSLLFSLFSGVIVDKFNKKTILYIVSFSSMILSLLFGILTIFGVITLLQIAIIAFLLGVVQAIEMPARLSFVSEMVGKEKLASAIALNSGMFNGARVIGPGVAGILIGLVGVGGTFIINGLSYIPAIYTLYIIHVALVKPKMTSNPIQAIKEGLLYSYNHPVIKAKGR